ncbi:ribophorin II [Nesidiocoris tenuis]|uniref:Dolichyl-diphosphooligosaccharide--protein glycosyltransferase subunit 2 n=1 Tax=Nesidiocoris tenuis TaxID=355587 RepID=A0ABN7ANK7_9HEMI|nr:ribophorin II [Nesidiocoris tenuis]
MRSLTLLSFCLAVSCCAAASNHLSGYDRQRLQQVIDSAFPPKNLASAHYGVLANKALNHAIPKPEDVCKFLSSSLSDFTNIEQNYYVASTWKAIGTCSGNIDSAAIIKSFNEALNKATSSIMDLYFATSGLKALGSPISSQTQKKTADTLRTLLKDDSVSNIAHALHIATHLGKEAAFAFDRIEDVLVLADEVDGKFLQFESGLGITALVISGTFGLAEELKKDPPITPQQTIKFANYFVSRRTVQTVKGAQNLLNVLSILSQNSFQTHVSVSVVGSKTVSLEDPTISMRVCDLLGRPVTAQIGLTLESFVRASDKAQILSMVKFEQTSDKMVYQARLVKPKGETPGLYHMTVSVTASAASKLIGNVEMPLDIKILGHAVFPKPLLIGTADADQVTQPKFEKLTYPNKLGQVLEVDSHQKLTLRFTVMEKVTNKPLNVHQAFILLTHQTTKEEFIFVAENADSEQYKLDLDLSSKSKDLSSGTYTIDLIIGDMILSNSVLWKVADVKLNLGSAVPSPAAPVPAMYLPKHEIKHLFREPERRPPVFVSNLFTGLLLIPLLLLFIMWYKLGINLSNFSFSLSTIGFHLGLGGIFCLFGLFWLQLNMFETLKYLLGLGLVTFLSGNSLLAKLANQHKR